MINHNIKKTMIEEIELAPGSQSCSPCAGGVQDAILLGFAVRSVRPARFS